ncbi:hypothetical protein PF005_g21650 [Phytophthora fragariae]|uniref:Uncharacterized protein n=1 Tax=Phytophthora fragariae TaxID=53985 RepID=A0A6A3S2T0_9STRA|nr:hypothetical protein PF003_g35771 [Phytophthora fragariae]KAE8985494.1 hypothetical protein PF011_g20365 [Phytophthora fragariae]KAE9083667.1 hypothetical protein PF010_g21123 [Phytophthora fragariae]KAE9108787.1 hypothetical protein PF006_g20806 [Phytophthora fragariae]KAE9184507.1 hypothetical protein PF005_g21650 [Phytophthora fragariae]
MALSTLLVTRIVASSIHAGSRVTSSIFSSLVNRARKQHAPAYPNRPADGPGYPNPPKWISSEVRVPGPVRRSNNSGIRTLVDPLTPALSDSMAL